MKLIYRTTPTDRKDTTRIAVRDSAQAEGTRDLLWLVKWPTEAGWSVQTPMINEPGVWHRGESIVHGSAGLTLNEAKRLAHLWLHHEGNREALTVDPRFQRLYAAVVGRREVQA